MQLPSSLLQNAVNEFSRLPGIGKKTALRLVLHLLKQDVAEVLQFGDAISRMRQDIKFCLIKDEEGGKRAFYFRNVALFRVAFLGRRHLFVIVLRLCHSLVRYIFMGAFLKALPSLTL